uniref:Nudix hydrolase 8 n=1 Tax=Ailuropoda melanoleuca TaxID=9646 RepID=A0A7N5KQ30_AILME
MLPDCLSAEGERRCRRLLAGATARLRARPAAAAVLVPLCSVRGVPALLYTLRSSRLAGSHKGDVSFPGGKCDPTDQDVVHTALRETHEELGLTVSEEHVWGVLRPVHDRAPLPAPKLRQGHASHDSLSPSCPSKRPPWCQCLPVWAHWIRRVSGPTPKRWTRYLCSPWPTCCRRRTKGIPTSAGVATSATRCLSSCTGPTVSGGSRPSSRSSRCSCWHLVPTSPAWPARRGPRAEGLATSSPSFTLPGQLHSRTE